jgi:hypothetical protein
MREIHKMFRVAFIDTRERRPEVDIETESTPFIVIQVCARDERDSVGRQVRRFRRALECAEETRGISTRKEMLRGDAPALFTGGKFDSKPAFGGLDTSFPSAFGNHFGNMHSLHQKWFMVVIPRGVLKGKGETVVRLRPPVPTGPPSPAPAMAGSRRRRASP